MARLGDNPSWIVYKLKSIFFLFLFHPPIPKSVNLVKLPHGTNLGKNIINF